MCTAVEKCLVWYQVNNISTYWEAHDSLLIADTIAQEKDVLNTWGRKPHWLPVNPLKVQQTETRPSLVEATSLSLDRVSQPWPYRHLGQLILQRGEPRPSPVGCLEVSVSRAEKHRVAAFQISRSFLINCLQRPDPEAAVRASKGSHVTGPRWRGVS